MARVKPKRHGVVTDMTAMCDVAFLLLTFFILTVQFREPDVEDIVTPSSVSTKLLEQDGVITINVTKDGRFSFSPVMNTAERLQVLEDMGNKYGISFTEDEKIAFKNTQFISVPMKQLKAFLNLSPEKRKEFKGGSVPIEDPNDPNNMELIEWVKSSALINGEVKLAVKGDASSSYSTYKKLFEGLRDIEYYKFVLITTEE